MKNANSVPELEMSASMPTGNIAANSDADDAGHHRHHVRGVEARVHLAQSTSGSRPSRDIVKRMRVWP